jgi:ribonuclease P protein component
MKKAYRLTEGREFQQVRQRGKSWAHPLLVLVVAPSKLPVTRHGFSVGKRVGKAHSRNLIKRRIREAVRVRQEGIKSGFDLVWIARNALTDTTDFWTLDQTVESLLKRAKLLQNVPQKALDRPKKKEESGVESQEPDKPV